MLSSILGTDGSPILQYLIVFVIMVVLLSLFALGAKRFARGRNGLASSSQRGRQPRLGIVDIYELDRQRQLILLRRDNVEHLLMVGGPNDLVVERDIQRGASARLPGETGDAEPAPRRPEIPADFTPEPMPVPKAERTPEVAASRMPEPAAPDAAEPKPLFPGVRSRRADIVAGRRTPPDLAAPRVEPLPAPPVLAPLPPRPPEPPVETPPAPEPEPVMDAAPPSPPAPPSLPSPVTPAPIRPASPEVDAGVLSDMARELEQALRRPSSAVSPAAPARAQAVQAPVIVAQASAPSPVPPKPAAAAPPPPPVEEPEIKGPSVPEPEPEAEPAPPPPPPARPALAREATPPEVTRLGTVRPEPAAPEPAPTNPSAGQSAANSPFSVEEIEAEFARLLGRPLDKKG